MRRRTCCIPITVTSTGQWLGLVLMMLLASLTAPAQSALPRDYTMDTLVPSGELYHPGGLALDGAGHLYVPDAGNNVIRRVDVSTGSMTVFAGSLGHTYKDARIPPATCKRNGDGCGMEQAAFGSPRSVALDREGNLFISDFWSSTIRRIDAHTGTISTYAGTRTGWSETQLHNPEGIAVDSRGYLYIADRKNNAVRKVAPPTKPGGLGVMTTIAGQGPASPGCGGDGGKATLATLSLPQDVAVDAAGNVYIADAKCRRVRMIGPDGIITTVMGSGVAAPDPYKAIPRDGQYHPGLAIDLAKPLGLFLDGAGHLYVSDAMFDVLWLYDTRSGKARLIAGMGPEPTVGPACADRKNEFGDGCPATQAKLNAGYRVAVDGRGNVYIAEHGMGQAQYPPYTIRVLRPVK